MQSYAISSHEPTLMVAPAKYWLIAVPLPVGDVGDVGLVGVVVWLPVVPVPPVDNPSSSRMGSKGSRMAETTLSIRAMRGVTIEVNPPISPAIMSRPICANTVDGDEIP